uniref:DUF868 domain-containing protein n=1 Tax=Oryza punctata TaxID=4537 RepID=A0A0E0M4N8_ORYPU
MRDFSCFGDGAVSLAAAAAASAAAAGAGAALDRSLQAATATVYKAALSSRKEILVRVMWTRSVAGAAPGATGLAVAVDEASRSSPSSAAGSAATPRRSAVTMASSPQFLHKKRGTRSFVTEAGTVVSIYWDTTEAKYPAAGSGSPEPTRDYYLAVVADGELAVLLGGGEVARELARRFAAAPRRAFLSRREQLRAVPASPAAAAAALAHSTRCRFRDDGAEHEVTVVCRGEEWGSRDGEVAVSIDGKKVVEARRVKWNFRGNRTVVLGDGAVVEVMWDVHDWWFAGGGGGGAQFMVKARGGAGDGDGGRVWMDEEMASKGQPPGGFFLHVQCYRR